MPQILVPIDVEDALRIDLTTAAEQGGFSFTFAAPPTPETLGDQLPYVRITRLGGTRSDIVVDLHAVSIDVYASSWAEAQDAANKVAGLLASLPYSDGLARDWFDAYLTTQPYNNPDPSHADLCRVSFAATVTTRAALI